MHSCMYYYMLMQGSWKMQLRQKLKNMRRPTASSTPDGTQSQAQDKECKEGVRIVCMSHAFTNLLN